ncbi:Gfo/Idh/MocA family protein [Paenibacillus oryzisoli]|uniref:Dehydrogenase n=1 Tax=Paenibacillus oryzisoli TaxID=1850517 RepID=A0A198A048_9BACL|nr:Gfo/Idh/MocA family oxidoreductase [Paenibacillus oryzisoli]OAS14396.1 dehydrogenase [Paenibacillus oryzisoli]
MTVKVAVVGVGFIGTVHIEALRRLNGVEVAAIMGSTQEKSKQKAEQLGVPKYYWNYDELLNDSEIESVHICTPNNMHFEMCKKALLAGKHLVCEKPLAMSVDEAQQLSKLALQSGLIHAICFNVRYYPLLQQLKSMVLHGELGEIYAVNGSYMQDWLFFYTDYNWRVESGLSGKSRAIADVGSHWMDLLESTTGLKITEVIADFSTVHKTRKKSLHAMDTYTGKVVHSDPSLYREVPIDTEDYANVLLRLDNGAKGSFTVSQIHAGRKNRVYVEIAGTKQTVAFDSEHPNYLWVGRRDGNNQVIMKDPSLLHTEVRRYADYPGGHNEGYPDTFKQLFKEIYAAMTSKEHKIGTKVYPDFSDGLREQMLCEGIVRSHLESKWVSIL